MTTSNWNEKAFIYLGVTFTSNGVLWAAASHFVRKATIATAEVVNVLVTSKSDSLQTKTKLLQFSIYATLRYESEVWSLRYTS